jgi:Lipid A disaccharide synthetase
VPEVIIIAGESSGDLHAAGVAEELRRLRPDLRLTGFGGPLMEKAGVELFDRYETGVMGFVEVIAHIPRHYFLLQSLRERFRQNKVALVIVIDYPGFNMKAAAAAKAAGISRPLLRDSASMGLGREQASHAREDCQQGRGNPSVRGESAARSWNRRNLRWPSAAR